VRPSTSTGYEYNVKAVPEPVVLAVPEPVSLAVPGQLVMSLSNHVEGPPPISLNSRRKHSSSRCYNAGLDAMVFSEVYDQ
jgi:hypothetical protein